MATGTKKGNHYPTRIMFCGCLHPDQDKIYGKQMRLHNPASHGQRHRCTICGQEK
jgi:hypothetical protein